MKHLLTPTCRYGCRFLQISDELWLCPHAAYGQLSYRLGAVEEARRLLDHAGGYDTVLARVVRDEQAAKDEKRRRRLEQLRRAVESVRYK